MNLSWCYVSTATPAFDPQRLDELYQSSREFNLTHGISGVLLYSGGRFCQLIEGPAAGMAEVMARVRGCPLHVHLLTLHEEDVPQAAFPSWSLGTASEWRGQRMEVPGDGQLARLTPAQQSACRVLRNFIAWEDAGSPQDFVPTRY
jgi:hypothetical protein